MDFRKIKYAGEEVSLKWETLTPDGDTVTHKMSSADDPEPEFVEAMQSLADDVLSLLELPDYYGENLTVTGLSMNYEDDYGRMGVVITCRKELPGPDAPLVLNTPHMKAPDPEDGGFSLSPRVVDRIEEVQRRAERYIEGHRAQGDLFSEEEEEEEGEAREPVPAGV